MRRLLMSEAKLNLVLFICALILLAVVGADNYMLRKKFNFIETQAQQMNLNLEALGIKIRDTDGKITVLQDGLAKNAAEDDRFREQTTIFARNVTKTLYTPQLGTK